MRLLTIIALFTMALSASADERIRLPSGEECWINRVGHVYGCSGNAAAAGARTRQPRCEWITEKEWEACERKKDWPGQPANCDHLLPAC